MFSSLLRTQRNSVFGARRFFGMRMSTPKLATLSYNSPADLERMVKDTMQFDYQDFEMYASNQLRFRNIPVQSVTPEEGRKIMEELMKDFMQATMVRLIHEAVQKDVAKYTASTYPSQTANKDAFSTTSNFFDLGLVPGLRDMIARDDLEGMVAAGLVQPAGPMGFRIRLFREDFVRDLLALTTDIRLWTHREKFTFGDGTPLNTEGVFGPEFKTEGFVALEEFGLRPQLEKFCLPMLNMFGHDAYKQAFEVSNVVGLLKDRVGTEVAAWDIPQPEGGLFRMESLEAVAMTFSYKKVRELHAQEFGQTSLDTPWVDVSLPSSGVVNLALCLDPAGHTVLVPAEAPTGEGIPEGETQAWQVPLQPGEALLFPDSVPVMLRVPEPTEANQSLSGDVRVNSLMLSGKSEGLNTFWTTETKKHLKRMHEQMVNKAKAEMDAENKQ